MKDQNERIYLDSDFLSFWKHSLCCHSYNLNPWCGKLTLLSVRTLAEFGQGGTLPVIVPLNRNMLGLLKFGLKGL